MALGSSTDFDAGSGLGRCQSRSLSPRHKVQLKRPKATSSWAVARCEPRVKGQFEPTARDRRSAERCPLQRRGHQATSSSRHSECRCDHSVLRAEECDREFWSLGSWEGHRGSRRRRGSETDQVLCKLHMDANPVGRSSEGFIRRLTPNQLHAAYYMPLTTYHAPCTACYLCTTC